MRLTLILFLSTITFSCHQTEEFNSEKWKNWKETEEHPNTRLKMMPSMKNKNDLKQLSKNEIVELLGEPDRKFENQWTYSLGPAGNGVNYASLSIAFNDTLCTKYSVNEH